MQLLYEPSTNTIQFHTSYLIPKDLILSLHRRNTQPLLIPTLPFDVFHTLTHSIHINTLFILLTDLSLN